MTATPASAAPPPPPCAPGCATCASLLTRCLVLACLLFDMPGSYVSCSALLACWLGQHLTSALFGWPCAADSGPAAHALPPRHGQRRHPGGLRAVWLRIHGCEFRAACLTGCALLPARRPDSLLMAGTIAALSCAVVHPSPACCGLPAHGNECMHHNARPWPKLLLLLPACLPACRLWNTSMCASSFATSSSHTFAMPRVGAVPRRPCSSSPTRPPELLVACRQAFCCCQGPSLPLWGSLLSCCPPAPPCCRCRPPPAPLGAARAGAAGAPHAHPADQRLGQPAGTHG